MGGGDLNLKKSWHPSTMKNQERVWKVEQQKAMEDKKIAEKRREIEQERMHEDLKRTAQESGAIKPRKEKLDWMYQGIKGNVNREEYLLGRKVDKTLELLNTQEKEEETPEPSKPAYVIEHEVAPESIVRRGGDDFQVDLKRKIAEDPLFFIKQQEEQVKKKITSNPVKMQTIQLLVKSLEAKKDKKSKKKKHKKESDSKKHKKKSKKRKRDSSSDSSSSSSSSEEESSPKRHKKQHQSSYSQRDSSDRRRTSPERSRHRISPRRDSRNSDSFHRKRRESPDRRDSHRYSDRRNHRDRSADRDQRRGRKSSQEMERLREQMKEAAKLQEKSRLERIGRYRDEEEKERRLENHSESFVRNMGSQSISMSVEDRIKSKAGFSQKGTAHMDKNFARR